MDLDLTFWLLMLPIWLVVGLVVWNMVQCHRWDKRHRMYRRTLKLMDEE